MVQDSRLFATWVISRQRPYTYQPSGGRSYICSMDDLWHYRWRIVLYGYHRTPRAEAITVDSVAELAAIIRASQRDPDVNRREHFRVREWIGPEPPHDCPSGITGWGTNNTHTRPCRCGTDHRIYRCGRCRIEVELPTRGPGCGELHWAPSN